MNNEPESKLNGRTLSETDIKAIVDALYLKVKSSFYEDLGRGLWRILWGVILMALIGIASVGQVKGTKTP